MIVLSPRAVARLESHQPAWPLAEDLPARRKGQAERGHLQGETINTPSMLVVEDALDGLRWAEAIGGLPALIARTEANAAVIARWVEAQPLGRLPGRDARHALAHLGLPEDHRSRLPRPRRRRPGSLAKSIADRLEAEGVAFDIGAYRDAPPGLRIWGGATVESADLEALLPWLDWAFAETRSA